MSMVMDFDSRRLIFMGEISVMEAEEIAGYLKDQLETLKTWNRIKIDIQELESLDSSILQILLSVYRTFPDKTVFSAPHPKAEGVFKTHGLKFASGG